LNVHLIVTLTYNFLANHLELCCLKWNETALPRLGVRFELTEEELQIYRPDGDRFLTFLELDQQRQQERQRAEQAEAAVEQERDRAKQAQAELEALRALLQERGISLDQL
ncbi:MAG: hypothetical protein ACYTXC_20465, partial [Nostoc sp.]